MMISPHFVWLDVETSGVRYDEHGILSLAMVRSWSSDDILSLEIRLRDDAIFDGAVTAINGYTENDARAGLGRINERDACYEIVKWMKGSPRGYFVAGANPKFDVEFVNSMFLRCGFAQNQWLVARLFDVQQVAVALHEAGLIELPPTKYSGSISTRLEVLASTLGVPSRQQDTHNCLEDVMMTRNVYWMMLQVISRGPYAAK